MARGGVQAPGDSFFHQIERRVEPMIRWPSCLPVLLWPCSISRALTGLAECRLHRLDKEKALWVPRDIQFPGFEFPNSNINAGVILIARKTFTMVQCLIHWLALYLSQ